MSLADSAEQPTPLAASGGWEELVAGTPLAAATDLRQLVDSWPDPLWVADHRGAIRFINAAAVDVVGEPAAQLLHTRLPFTPEEPAITLNRRRGEPVSLALRWVRVFWDGNPAWAVMAGSAASAQGSGHPQLELRCEQLQEQLHRLQGQLGDSEAEAGRRRSELEETREQGEQLRAELAAAQRAAAEAERDARSAEANQLERMRMLEERCRELEARLTTAVQHIRQRKERERLLQEQLQSFQERTHGELEEQTVRQMSEQLARIQMLEGELERLAERTPASRDDSEWEELRTQAGSSREQALRAENRAAHLEQKLFDQEQRARESDLRADSLTARLTQTELQAEQVRLDLESQLEQLSFEEQEAKRLAFEDSLTGLPNLNILQQYLDFTVGMVGRSEGAAALVLIDVDRLRSLNTTLGVMAGDDLLRQLAGRLKGLCRNTDVLGRRGDDEFLVVVALQSNEIAEARSTVAQIAQSLASKVLGACSEPFILAGEPIMVTCSIGLTLFGDESVDETLEQVQAALDRARESGRGRFQFFGPELHDRLRRRHATVPRLTEALEKQEFVLNYQPIVDLRNGRMVGMEALLRWHDPKQGIVEPAGFLPAAESSGLIVPIGEWAVQEACLMAAQYRDLFVSVNLSPRQLMHGDFPRRFMKAVERARVRPEKIVVEISEATTSADPERISQVLSELARWNVGLAIDDFGTGSSNLLRLQREKPRFLKIDHAFVTQLPDDRTSFHVVLAGCHLAASLQMQSLAEGVETEAQLQTLKRMGCQLAQGRLLSPPVAGSQVKELLRKTWKV